MFFIHIIHTFHISAFIGRAGKMPYFWHFSNFFPYAIVTHAWIAASATASEPFINFFAMFLSSWLVLFNGDYRIGAGAGAACTGNACGLIDDLCGVVALFVELMLRKLKDLFRTCTHAKTAALAATLVNGKFDHRLTSLNLRLAPHLSKFYYITKNGNGKYKNARYINLLPKKMVGNQKQISADAVGG